VAIKVSLPKAAPEAGKPYPQAPSFAGINTSQPAGYQPSYDPMARYRGNNALDIEWWPTNGILDRFETNSVAAKDYFLGRRVGIYGTVLTVSNNAFGGDRAAVILDTNDGTTIDVWFDGSARKQIGTIRPGTTVYMTAIYEGQEYKSLVFNNGDFPWPNN
jgi:hypothetical protein